MFSSCRIGAKPANFKSNPITLKELSKNSQKCGHCSFTDHHHQGIIMFELHSWDASQQDQALNSPWQQRIGCVDFIWYNQIGSRWEVSITCKGMRSDTSDLTTENYPDLSLNINRLGIPSSVSQILSQWPLTISSTTCCQSSSISAATHSCSAHTTLFLQSKFFCLKRIDLNLLAIPWH